MLVPRPPPGASKRPRTRGDSRSFSRPAKRKLVTAEVEAADDIVGDIRNLYAGEEETAMMKGRRSAGQHAPDSPEFPELGKRGEWCQRCGWVTGRVMLDRPSQL